MRIIINLNVFEGIFILNSFYFPKKDVLYRSCGYLKEIDEKCDEGCILNI
jgi:hypothetical protein